MNKKNAELATVVEKGDGCSAKAFGMNPEALAIGHRSRASAETAPEAHNMALALASGTFSIAEARGHWATSVGIGACSRSIVYGDGNYAVAIGSAPEAYALGKGGTAIAIVEDDDAAIVAAGPEGKLIIVLADDHGRSRRVFEATIGDRHIFAHRPYTVDRKTGEFYEIRPGDRAYDAPNHPESIFGDPAAVKKLDAELQMSYGEIKGATGAAIQ